MKYTYIYVILGICAVAVSIGKALAVNFGISKYLSKKPYEGDYNFKKVVLYTLGTNYILLSAIVLFILGTIVLMKLISFLSRKVLNPFITRTNNRLDDIIYYSLESPVKFAIMLLGIWIAIHRLVSPDSFVKVIDNAYKILIILDITWIFARLSSSCLLYTSDAADE